jgi:hypothetical protein
MENDDTTNDRDDTSANPYPVALKKQTRKERSKANATAQKPKQDKKKSYRRSWRSASPLRKLEIIALGIGSMVGIVYLSVTIWGVLQNKWNFQAEHKPIVIHSRPPALLQTFSCTADNGFKTGNMQTFIKNIGNATAEDVFPYWFNTKVVPEKKTGNAFFDDPPEINSSSCEIAATTDQKIVFPVNAGTEMSANIQASAGTIGYKLEKGDKVQLWSSACVFYADDFGGRHGTCDTYRLAVPSNESQFRIFGSPILTCDGTEYTGIFVQTTGGRCQK